MKFLNTKTVSLLNSALSANRICGRPSRLKQFGCFAVFGVVASAVSVLLSPRYEPTEQEVAALKGAMPGLIADRLADAALLPGGSPWQMARVIKTSVPFEDWYGFKGAHHSLKANVLAQGEDGRYIVATYRLGLDDSGCQKRPQSCADLTNLSVVAVPDEGTSIEIFR